MLAAFLGQLQMLWDCCDGEVARWRGTSSPVGVFLDKVGHYTAEGLIPIALGVRADGGLDSIGGWTTLGALLAVLVLFNKALNDAVHVARAAAGLPRLEDRAEVGRPDGGRAPPAAVAGALPAVQPDLPLGRADVARAGWLPSSTLAAGGLVGTRALVAVLVPVAVVTVAGHLLAILTSSRLR